MEEFERAHLEKVRALAPECVVLLRSDGTFPLDAPCDVALYGGARRTVPGGTGSGEVNARFNVSVEKGLERAGFHVTTKDWLSRYEKERAKARKSFLSGIRSEARKAGVDPISYGMGAVMPEPEYRIPLTGTGKTCIYVLSRVSGEGSDRRAVPGDILLTGTEKRDILLCQRKYERFLLVLNVGGAVDLSPLSEVKNILLLSQLGAVTGDVLSDIVLGRAYPSGRLADTWAAWEDYCKIGEFGGRDDTRYREGVYVGYRYFDTVGKKPVFPFGFGLSYTGFARENVNVSLSGETVSVTAEIKNTGSRPGKDVFQVYVSVPAGKLDQPAKALAAYVKTGELAPGRSETVTASFRLSDMASYDEEQSAWVLEKGDYILLTGPDSAAATPVAALRLSESAVTLKAKRCFSGAGFADWKPEDPVKVRAPSGLPVLEVAPDAIPERAAVCGRKETVDPLIAELTDEELAYMNIGSFDPKGGVMSVIGNQSSAVAGAAGETTRMLEGRGIPSLVMADGPAGLRLTPKYYRDAEGVHGINGGIPASFLELMPRHVALFLKLIAKKPPRNAKIEEQYAVSLPIGTALAQSWNTKLIESCGDMVGDEMERFGVNVWLAPALNLHRDIRCGRNYEYYSEDPLISGLCAAAMTRGVQRHPGRAVAIKHFAANNQETNRYRSVSAVSERALREMYLRGFGICVRLARPGTVMTSYNLINGVHSSESRELLEEVLRDEFGFEGVVMTDWVIGTQGDRSSLHPGAVSPNVAKAGGELFMPGSREDYDRLLAAIRDGAVSREQLRLNATRLLKLIRSLTAPEP